MNDIIATGAFPLGDQVVKRLGYAAMQLAGPGVFGPPSSGSAAISLDFSSTASCARATR